MRYALGTIVNTFSNLGLPMAPLAAAAKHDFVPPVRIHFKYPFQLSFSSKQLIVLPGPGCCDLYQIISTVAS